MPNAHRVQLCQGAIIWDQDLPNMEIDSAVI